MLRINHKIIENIDTVFNGEKELLKKKNKTILKIPLGRVLLTRICLLNSNNLFNLFVGAVRRGRFISLLSNYLPVTGPKVSLVRHVFQIRATNRGISSDKREIQ